MLAGSNRLSSRGHADMIPIAGALGRNIDTKGKLGPLIRFTMRRWVSAQLILCAGAVPLLAADACANVANLMLARASVRQKRSPFRAALGASRLRIIRLLITESVMLALVGGALGLLTAYLGTSLALKALPDALPRVNDIKVDANVLLFTLAASLITGVVFGLAPALQASNPNLNETLKECGRRQHPARIAQGARWRNCNLLVLLVGSGLLVRSLSRQRVNEDSMIET